MIQSLIFFPEKEYAETPRDYGILGGEVWIPMVDGTRLMAWHLKAKEAKGNLVFFHGNAGNISHRLFKVKGWIENGYSVLLVDYRGYGRSEGTIQSAE